MLEDLAADLASRQLRLAVSNPSERVLAMFERSGLLDTIGAVLQQSAGVDFLVSAQLHCPGGESVLTRQCVGKHPWRQPSVRWSTRLRRLRIIFCIHVLLFHAAGSDYVFVRIRDAVQFCKTLMVADGEQAPGSARLRPAPPE